MEIKEFTSDKGNNFGGNVGLLKAVYQLDQRFDSCITHDALLLARQLLQQR